MRLRTFAPEVEVDNYCIRSWGWEPLHQKLRLRTTTPEIEVENHCIRSWTYIHFASKYKNFCEIKSSFNMLVINFYATNKKVWKSQLRNLQFLLIVVQFFTHLRKFSTPKWLWYPKIIKNILNHFPDPRAFSLMINIENIEMVNIKTLSIFRLFAAFFSHRSSKPDAYRRVHREHHILII